MCPYSSLTPPLLSFYSLLSSLEDSSVVFLLFIFFFPCTSLPPLTQTCSHTKFNNPSYSYWKFEPPNLTWIHQFCQEFISILMPTPVMGWPLPRWSFLSSETCWKDQLHDPDFSFLDSYIDIHNNTHKIIIRSNMFWMRIGKNFMPFIHFVFNVQKTLMNVTQKDFIMWSRGGVGFTWHVNYLFKAALPLFPTALHADTISHLQQTHGDGTSANLTWRDIKHHLINWTSNIHAWMWDHSVWQGMFHTYDFVFAFVFLVAKKDISRRGNGSLSVQFSSSGCMWVLIESKWDSCFKADKSVTCCLTNHE